MEETKSFASFSSNSASRAAAYAGKMLRSIASLLSALRRAIRSVIVPEGCFTSPPPRGLVIRVSREFTGIFGYAPSEEYNALRVQAQGIGGRS